MVLAIALGFETKVRKEQNKASNSTVTQQLSYIIVATAISTERALTFKQNLRFVMFDYAGFLCMFIRRRHYLYLTSRASLRCHLKYMPSPGLAIAIFTILKVSKDE